MSDVEQGTWRKVAGGCSVCAAAVLVVVVVVELLNTAASAEIERGLRS